jgi:hypothetical protein
MSNKVLDYSVGILILQKFYFFQNVRKFLNFTFNKTDQQHHIQHTLVNFETYIVHSYTLLDFVARSYGRVTNPLSASSVEVSNRPANLKSKFL